MGWGAAVAVPVRTSALITLGVVALVSGCAVPSTLPASSDRLNVITTTGLIRDFVEQVGGDRVHVASIVPDGADPHGHEPTLRDARNVVYADVAFSNYAMLEEQSIIRTLDANLSEDATSVALVEESVKYAAELIPLVENVMLDAVWLGMRVEGEGDDLDLSRSSQVHVSAQGATGPGEIYAFLTGTFGDTSLYFDTSDGFDSTTGYRDDTMSLPPDAHTHLSWAFTEPGVYTLDLAGSAQADDTTRPVPVAEGTVTFAVGVEPGAVAAELGPRAVVLDSGHADVSVNLDTRALEVRHDPEGQGHHAQNVLDPADVVIHVPANTLDLIPESEEYRFMGRPGTQVYQLPQAVLGKHVHGEIDPHLWHDVHNAMAYVQLIRDTLIEADPEGALEYRANAAAYLDELELLDAEVSALIGAIPEERRQLITTHDAFGYLAHAYDVSIAGFVTPNPAAEPSLAQRRRLAETLRTLEIPAVFMEPNLASRSATLTELARERDVAVCSIYSDSFDAEVTNYIALMRFNANSLHDCLTADPSA